jgi:hypothetical protein
MLGTAVVRKKYMTVQVAINSSIPESNKAIRLTRGCTCECNDARAKVVVEHIL